MFKTSLLWRGTPFQAVRHMSGGRTELESAQDHYVPSLIKLAPIGYWNPSVINVINQTFQGFQWCFACLPMQVMSHPSFSQKGLDKDVYFETWTLLGPVWPIMILGWGFKRGWRRGTLLALLYTTERSQYLPNSCWCQRWDITINIKAYNIFYNTASYAKESGLRTNQPGDSRGWGHLDLYVPGCGTVSWRRL